MAHRPWLYLQNTFLVSTEFSYRKCLKIADYTLATLSRPDAEPFIVALHAALQPSVAAYSLLYSQSKQQRGKQKSKTFALAKELRTLSGSKIIAWDVQVQIHYPQGSSDYIKLLPRRRSPFQRGSQDDRITAVGAFSKALEAVPALALLKADVDDFYQTLLAAFAQQQGNKSGTRTSSTALEHARVAVCEMLYATLAQLMAHHYKSPEVVASYFDTESIRQHTQRRYQGHLKAGATKTAITHTFEGDEEIRIINKGNTELLFSLCHTTNAAVAATAISIAPLSEQTLPASSFGNEETQRFLRVYNPHHSLVGSYVVVWR